MTDLTKRVIAAVAIGPFILAAFWFLPSQWFLLFVLVVAILPVAEVVAIAGVRERFLPTLLVIVSSALLYLGLQKVFFLSILFAPALYVLLRLAKGDGGRDGVNRDVMVGIMAIMAAQVFVVLPIYHFYLLKTLNNAFPLLILFAIWASDVGAYFIGKGFGKHLLVPVISPKKTLEGLAGAALGSMVVITLARNVVGITVVEALVLGCILGVLGQVGDIMESAGKRMAEVKDSSSLIPGHGGMLDRMDSFILTVPVIYYYITGLAGLTS